MKLRWLAIPVLAVMAVFTPAVLPASATQLIPPPPCASGSFTITNYESGWSVVGNGTNHPVVLSSPGNCFHVAFTGTGNGLTWHEYQNGDGHCLFQTGDVLELGINACAPGHPNEEITALTLTSRGWTLGTEATIGLEQNSAGCVSGAEIQESSGLNCDHWNFP